MKGWLARFFWLLGCLLMMMMCVLFGFLLNMVCVVGCYSG